VSDTSSNAAARPTTAAADFAIDTEKQTFSSALNGYVAKLKSGELGALPAMLAILVLGGLFGFARTESFMSVQNLGNLIQQAAPIMVISMGVSFVLLLGEIDLAAGFTAGVAAATVAVLLREPRGWPLWASLLIALGATIALGFFTGFLVAKVGIPSFVVTLANFLSFQGVVLLIIGKAGTVGVPNKVIYSIENGNLAPKWSWALLVLSVALYGYSQVRRYLNSNGTMAVQIVALRIAAVAIIGAIFVQLLSKNRAFASAAKKLQGVPWAAPLVLALMFGLHFILKRTTYGRHLYAVGGNTEAARRAGINVVWIRMSAFVICAVLAGIGGLFLASRTAVDPQTGGNQTLLLAVGAAVIGGTSLFGGRGRMANCILGGVVIALIDNGLPLLGKAKPFGFKTIDFSASGVKFIVSGLVLLLAASVDALSRKRS
jgi:D-xylose transport system permease protein